MKRSARKFHLYEYSALLLALIVAAHPGPAAGQKPDNGIGMGIEVGSWKPNNLAAEPSVSPFGAPAAKPYYGISLNSPAVGSFVVRISAGLWAHDAVPEVFIIPLSLDLKHFLIGQSSFSPYVCYGGTLYLGAERALQAPSDLKGDYSNGYGVNLGAGFDLQLSRSWRIFLEFDFHYVKFQHVLGKTADYSGPKLMTGLYVVL